MTNKLAYIVPSIFVAIVLFVGLSHQYKNSKHRENEKNARESIDQHREHMTTQYGGKKSNKMRKSKKSKTKRRK